MLALRSFFPHLKTRIQSFFRAAWQAFKPGPRAVQGAGLGVLVVCGLAYLAFAISGAEGPLAPGVLIVLAELALGALLLFLGQGLAKLLEWIARIPWPLRWALVGGVLLTNLALIGLKPEGALLVAAVLLAGGMLIGGGTAALVKTGWRNLRLIQRAAAGMGLLVGGLGMLGGLAWYGVYRGFPEQAVINAASEQYSVPRAETLAELALPDPSKPGPYPVRTLTYGAGNDRLRPEYGAGAALKTQPVDGAKLLKGSWDGITGQLRTLYWGFDPKNLPLNGRVWYPDAKTGTFPLVLIVHGNHLSSDFSDPGYAYLGELLASRGFIFVSVDENFLNGSPTDFTMGMKDENDARGWLLLEHLKTWDSWNRTAGNPFYGMVDMQAIAVMGHSRGGEAAAIAAAFNRLPYYPDDYGLAFDFNYNIKAVVAIAPSDGQYAPTWRNTPLSNVSYFVLQGSHDSDVTSFTGLRQYERVRFDDGADWFKAALYIYRANHGQFNSVWGDNDQGMLRGGFLNRAALLPAAEQAQVAKVYLSAFLEAALRGERGYLPLFLDARAAGPGWLPDGIYINRLDQAGDRLLAGYDEDISLSSTTWPSGHIDGQELATWREQRIQTKWSGGETNVVYLGWNRPASYTITLPAQGYPVISGDALIFDLADAGQDPDPYAPSKNATASPSAQKPAGPRQPLDLTVLLEDASGEQAALPISRYLAIQPQLTAHLYKASLFETNRPSEPIMQSYVLPLADFVRINPQFHPETLRAIRFVFDRTPLGSVVLDGVGLRSLGK